MSNETKPGCSGLRYMGDEKLPSYKGLKREHFINHSKDPYQTTRIQLNVRVFFCGSSGL